MQTLCRRLRRTARRGRPAGGARRSWSSDPRRAAPQPASSVEVGRQSATIEMNSGCRFFPGNRSPCNPSTRLVTQLRSAGDFRDLLQSFNVQRLVDVRQFPGSKRYPHFSSAALKEFLAEAGIEYAHEVDLGGRRRSQGESPNGFWKNASFRAFADYMATPVFAGALDRLSESALLKPTVIMCAEAVPWRCHRWLISDALAARGRDVMHIIGPKTAKPHVLNASARVASDGTLTYPAATTTADGQSTLW